MIRVTFLHPLLLLLRNSKLYWNINPKDSLVLKGKTCTITTVLKCWLYQSIDFNNQRILTINAKDRDRCFFTFKLAINRVLWTLRNTVSDMQLFGWNRQEYSFLIFNASFKLLYSSQIHYILHFMSVFLLICKTWSFWPKISCFVLHLQFPWKG